MRIKTILVDKPSKPHEAPALRPLTYENTRTGRSHNGYVGIDPGFEHNPGTNREALLRTQWHERDRIFAGTMEPHPDAAPVREALDASGAGSQRTAAMPAIRAVERVHGAGGLGRLDAKGKREPLPIRESATTEKAGEYVYDQIGTGHPQRIDVSSEGRPQDRWPALIAAEEIGHHLDHVGMSGGAKDPGDWESYAQQTPEMQAVMNAICESGTYDILPVDSHRRWPWELWGRAYAQYIAWRSGSSRMKADLDKVLTHADPGERVRYWPYDEFTPVAEAIDALMEVRGWAKRKKP